MAVEITVPQMGESVVEATVGPWLKAAGDHVEAGEGLVELETDKVNVEVPAPAAGTLQSIAKQEGETVGIGDVLATMSEGAAAAQPAQPQASGETAPATSPPAAPSRTIAEERPLTPAASAENGEAARATPLARRIAAEHGIDLGAIQGTGPSGRVRREDVDAYVQARQAPSHPNAGGAAPSAASPPQILPAPAPADATRGRWEERVRMSRRRQTIAQRLVEAQHTAAMLTTFNEVDLSAILDLRRRRRDAFKEEHGVNLGFMSFFTRAAVGALKAFPRLNAEIQGNEMVLKHYYDIGIAVGTDEGLVVPVVRDADRLSFAAIERQIAELARKARDRQLGLAELQGGTFTITNGGVYGSLLSTPILNAPQVGILGMHKIQERPVAVNGEVVVRPMMYLALSYDHRIVDGSEAVRFLVRVKALVEDPETLLLEG